MSTAFAPCQNRTDWKSLYAAAIRETNKGVLPQRVSEAEAAVIARRREIFYADGTPEEKRSLGRRTLCPPCVYNGLAAQRSCVIPYPDDRRYIGITRIPDFLDGCDFWSKKAAPQKRNDESRYCNFAYSSLAWFRMRMSGLA